MTFRARIWLRADRSLSKGRSNQFFEGLSDPPVHFPIRSWRCEGPGGSRCHQRPWALLSCGQRLWGVEHVVGGPVVSCGTGSMPVLTLVCLRFRSNFLQPSESMRWTMLNPGSSAIDGLQYGDDGHFPPLEPFKGGKERRCCFLVGPRPA